MGKNATTRVGIFDGKTAELPYANRRAKTGNLKIPLGRNATFRRVGKKKENMTRADEIDLCGTEGGLESISIGAARKHRRRETKVSNLARSSASTKK